MPHHLRDGGLVEHLLHKYLITNFFFSYPFPLKPKEGKKTKLVFKGTKEGLSVDPCLYHAQPQGYIRNEAGLAC